LTESPYVQIRRGTSKAKARSHNRIFCEPLTDRPCCLGKWWTLHDRFRFHVKIRGFFENRPLCDPITRWPRTFVSSLLKFADIPGRSLACSRWFFDCANGEDSAHTKKNRMIQRRSADPSESPLGFRDLYETLLNKLRRPRDGIGVDLDSGNEVGISAFPQPWTFAVAPQSSTCTPRSIRSVTKFLVWVAITVRIVRLVV